jgi:hypothetical protein
VEVDVVGRRLFFLFLLLLFFFFFHILLLFFFFFSFFLLLFLPRILPQLPPFLLASSGMSPSVKDSIFFLFV